MSDTEVIAQLFGEHGQLGVLKADERKTLAGACELQKLQPEEMLFKQGDLGSSMFIVKEGLVRISKKTAEGTDQTIILAKKGDIIGELSLFDNSSRSASAKAMAATEVVVLSKEKFEGMKASAPAVAVNLMEVFIRELAKRLRKTTARMYGDFDDV